MLLQFTSSSHETCTIRRNGIIILGKAGNLKNDIKCVSAWYGSYVNGESNLIRNGDIDSILCGLI